MHGVHSVHGPKTTVHQQVVAAATASMAAEHGSSSNRVAQAAGSHHHHHHPHHPHVPAVSAAAPHGPHGVIQSHPGVVHSHPSTTAVVHVLPPPPQTTVVQVKSPGLFAHLINTYRLWHIVRIGPFSCQDRIVMEKDPTVLISRLNKRDFVK